MSIALTAITAAEATDPPSSWPSVPVRDVVTRTETTDPSRSGRSSFLYIDVSAVSNDDLSIVTPQELATDKAPSRARKRIATNDVIFATVRPALRRIAQIPKMFDGAVASTAFCVLRPRPDLVDSAYLFHAVASPDFVSRVASHEKGTSYPAVLDSDVLNEAIPLPPLAEQRRIAGIISTIRRSRAAAETEIACIRAGKAAALRALFVEAAPSDGPGAWRLTTIGDLCEGIYDGPHATPRKTSAGPWFLSISSLNQGRLDLVRSAHLSEEDWLTWSRRVVPRKDDVVFSYETRLGEVALIPDGIRSCLGRRLALLRPNPKKVNPGFLVYSYLAPEFQATLKERTVEGSTVHRLPLATFAEFPIRVPALDAQRAIATVMRSFDRSLDASVGCLRDIDGVWNAAIRALVGVVQP
jgi:restriction endonuclease S subunit